MLFIALFMHITTTSLANPQPIHHCHCHCPWQQRASSHWKQCQKPKSYWSYWRHSEKLLVLQLFCKKKKNKKKKKLKISCGNSQFSSGSSLFFAQIHRNSTWVQPILIQYLKTHVHQLGFAPFLFLINFTKIHFLDFGSVRFRHNCCGFCSISLQSNRNSSIYNKLVK